jgi:N6-adenosine-specific RNA methylase IME4
MKFFKIIADPPWLFSDKLTMSSVKRGAGEQYQTLNVARLKKLGPLVQAAAGEDAVLALWFVSSQVSAALGVMESWGFSQKQVWTWVKTTKDGNGLAFGMGRLSRNCTENLLVGTRGKVYKHLETRSERNAFMSPATRHSVKPNEVHAKLDRMFPTQPGLELFARRPYSGWTTLGAECPEDGKDIFTSLSEFAE